MQDTVVREGVLKSTWTVKTKIKADDGLTIDVSTFTGDEANRLLRDDENGRPFVRIIEAALGSCGHGLENQKTGSMESEFCMQCNVAAIFFQYATLVLPVMKAKTAEDLDKHSKSRYGVSWGTLTSRLEGEKSDLRDSLLLQFDPSLDVEVTALKKMTIRRQKTGIDCYDDDVKKWGRLLVHTYTGGGSRYIISDYCKLQLFCFF